MNRREESQEQETAGITAANEVNESSWSGIWYGASAPDSSQGSLLLEQPGLPSGSAVAGQQQLAASRIANVSGSINSNSVGPISFALLHGDVAAGFRQLLNLLSNAALFSLVPMLLVPLGTHWTVATTTAPPHGGHPPAVA
eukprot:GHVU01064967.1.p2 GENE.GHVU01064967.1~~GHVU01064967.1.p2  ORF type:complete len:141 (+),score=16.14 GHVU01064967.1:147-569(+)